MKYNSEENLILLFNRGIKLIKLISKQIHKINQELEETIKIILKNKIGRKINLQ